MGVVQRNAIFSQEGLCGYNFSQSHFDTIIALHRRLRYHLGYSFKPKYVMANEPSITYECILVKGMLVCGIKLQQRKSLLVWYSDFGRRHLRISLQCKAHFSEI